MPIAPKHPCRHPGCSALLEAGAGGYCAAHRRKEQGARSREQDQFRGSAASRGYDQRWQAFRLHWLARWPLCGGVLIPTADWRPSLAMQFHDLREAARAAGDLLPLSDLRFRPEPVEGRVERAPISDLRTPISEPPAPSSLLQWLRLHPIYHFRPWDIGQPGTVIDHITPHRGDPELLWAEWNLQTLTKRAHDRKTAREDGGFRGAWSKEQGAGISSALSVPSVP